MALFRDDPLTQVAFGLYQNQGVFALLLGSGLSSAAGIPTGWAITLDLIRRVGAARGLKADPPNGWAAWYRDQTGEEPSYSHVVAQLGQTAAERRAILDGYIEPTSVEREQGVKLPTKAHYAIADLIGAGCIRVVITTNFDRLLENALRDRGLEPTVVASSDALRGAEPLTHSQCYILKLHGDYKDSRILNTDQELARYPKAFNTQLDRIFDEFGLIVCGWSGEWDRALCAAIKRSPNRRYPMYWAAHGRITVGGQDMIEHRRGTKIPIQSADHFFTDLYARVLSIKRTHRDNPLTVELLVSTVKRYLAREEHRIELDDLLDDESKRLLENLNHQDFDAHSASDDESLHQRIERYEATTERLMAVAGALGRWGDGRELQFILDVIKTNALHREQHNGGNTLWLKLRTYPAVLITTFYGVGLVRARRWRSLYDLFTAPVHNSVTNSMQSVVTTFHQWLWEAAEPNIWRRLPGYETTKEPLGKRLFDVLSRETNQVVNGATNVGYLMGKYEQLAAIAQIEHGDTEQLQAVVDDPDPARICRAAPGYAASFGPATDLLISELDQKEFRTPLLEAGFGRKNDTHLRACITNHRKVVARVRGLW